MLAQKEVGKAEGIGSMAWCIIKNLGDSRGPLRLAWRCHVFRHTPASVGYGRRL